MEWIKKQVDRVFCSFSWSLGILLSLTVIVASIIMILAIICCWFPNALRGFILVFGSHPKEISPENLKMLTSLVQGGYIMPATDLLNLISGFYNSLIVILVTLLTILGFANYLYVGRISKRHAEELVATSIDKTLGNADYLYNTFTKQEEFSQILKNFDKIAQIESAVTALSYAVKKEQRAKPQVVKPQAKKTKGVK